MFNDEPGALASTPARSAPHLQDILASRTHLDHCSKLSQHYCLETACRHLLDEWDGRGLFLIELLPVGLVGLLDHGVLGTQDSALAHVGDYLRHCILMQTHQDVRVRRGDLLEVGVESVCDGYRLFQNFLSIGREVLLVLELAEQDLHPVNDGVRRPVDMPSDGLGGASMICTRHLTGPPGRHSALTHNASSEEREEEPDIVY